RNTPWRQGQFLAADTVTAFGLELEALSEEVAAVVISHDCDLAQRSDIEPTVEIIVGRFIEGRVNGNFTHCKNPRRLHVECSGGTKTVVVDLEARRRCTLNKDSADGLAPGLADYSPCAARGMTAKERKTLQLWLAARYHRSAFSDEFDRRLNEETGVAERLANVFRETGKYVVAVFFDVDEGQEKTRRGPDDTYELLVTLLYAPYEDPEAAEVAAKQAAARIEEIFQSRCKATRDGAQVWQWIELQGVEVTSDQALTYTASQQLTKWHADHISLRVDPEQPLLGT
ncbi:MAG: hypothetical protein ACREV2_18900, partial [Burkholderiales bacterium]